MSVPSYLPTPLAALFQDQALIRSFEDSLRPNLLYNAIAPEPQEWPGNAALNFKVTNDGYYDVVATPSPTSVDPTPQQRRAEQFLMTLVSYQDTADIDATQAQNMLSDYAVQTYSRLGLQAAETVDAAQRGIYTSAAEAGWTVASAAYLAGATSIHVERLNGFTTAFKTTGSSLSHDPVSPTNPLSIFIAGVANTVIGFAADNQIPVNQGTGVDDEVGPGTLTLGTPLAAGIPSRAPVVASNASWVYRAGAGLDRTSGSIDDVTAPLSYAAIKQARAQFSSFGVRGMRRFGGRYLAVLSPSAYAQLQGDPEYQRLNQTLGIEDPAYVEGVVGVVSQTVFVESNNAPIPNRVHWYDGTALAKNPTPFTYGRFANYGLPNASSDAIGIELNKNGNTDEVIDHTVLFGDDAVKTFWQPHPLFSNVAQLQEIGVAGAVAEPYRVVNDSIVFDTDYIHLIMIAPRNRTADKFPVTWQTKRSWTVKSDQISRMGGAAAGARYKRVLAIQSLASM